MEEISSTKRFDEVISKYKYVFVNICADWCSPCKRIAPAIEELASEYTTIKFIKFDCDELPSLSRDLNISSLPTFILFKEGEIIERIKGANVQKVKEMLDQY